jgi:hypothetical protein
LSSEPVRAATRPRAHRLADVALNTASSAVFALGLLAWASRIDQAAFAASLIDYSLAIVLAWLVTLGAPTRFVSLASAPVESLASVVWQTLLLAASMCAALAGIAIALAHLQAWLPHAERVGRLAVLTPIVLLGYVGREVSNLAYGRVHTAAACFVQVLLGAAACYALMLSSVLNPLLCAAVFLAVYYTAGGVQLLVFLFQHPPHRDVLRFRFVREAGRTNLALGFGTLLLGNVDKIVLGYRPTLGGVEVAYVIADRLAGAYATVMTYYTQSRVQSAIVADSWRNMRPVAALHKWLRHSAPSLALFALIGAVALALAAYGVGLPAPVGSIGALVGAICLVAYLKSASGYAIRLLDTSDRRDSFNRIAGWLIAAGGLTLVLTRVAPVELIVAVKLTLHVLMLLLLRNACITAETAK